MNQFKVGDKVRDIIKPERGEGEVTRVATDGRQYPIRVRFEKVTSDATYTADGCELMYFPVPSLEKIETEAPAFKVGDKVHDTDFPEWGEGTVACIRSPEFDYPVWVAFPSGENATTYTMDGRILTGRAPSLQKVETPSLKVGDKVHDAGAPEWGHGVVAEVDEQNGVLVQYHNYRTPIRYTSEGAFIPGRYPTLRQE